MGRYIAAVAALFLIWISSGPAMALSPEQVIALKKAGVDDQTIQMMIRQEEAAKNHRETSATVREIKDRDGNVTVVYSPGSRPRELDEAEQRKLDKAWEMLQHVIIDGRK
jgi:hypothetical protein